MKKLLLLLSCVLLLASPALAEVKIGVVDLDRALAECEVGKATLAKLSAAEKDFVEKMKEQEAALKKEIGDYQNQAKLMKPGARTDKEAELEKKVIEFQQSEQLGYSQLKRQQQAALQPLQEDLYKVAQEVSKTEGFDFVFSKIVMVHSRESADFTDKVIAEANKSLKK